MSATFRTAAERLFEMLTPIKKIYIWLKNNLIKKERETRTECKHFLDMIILFDSVVLKLT